MDKGREVFRQADLFLRIAAENGLVPKAHQEHLEVRYNIHETAAENGLVPKAQQEPKQVRYMECNMRTTCLQLFSRVFYTKVMELGGLLVQITHVQVILPSHAKMSLSHQTQTILLIMISSPFTNMQRELAKAELDKQRRELNER